MHFTWYHSLVLSYFAVVYIFMSSDFYFQSEEANINNLCLSFNGFLFQIASLPEIKH